MKNTTVINNSVIDDKQLSLKAIGLYMFMKRQPSTYGFTLLKIVNDFGGKDRIKSIMGAMKELKAKNMVSFSKNKDGTVDYIVK